jgi:hypothetical protein
MVRLVLLCSIAASLCAAAPARAGEFSREFSWPCFDTAYWCTRDAIYHQYKVIARLEANPDVDDGIKGPVITAARAEIHRLRATLHEPPPRDWATIASPPRAATVPCCYARRPLYIR